MNPLIARNPMGNMMQMMNQLSQLRQNPNGIADFLKGRGCITDEQYSAIQKMNGDPAQIGQYLMQAGGISQQQAEKAVNAVAPNFRR